MLRVAKGRSAVRRAGARVDLSLGDDDGLDFPRASFDRIVALHSFQFWAAPEQTVNRLRRLLREGGRVVLVLRDHSKRAPAWLPNPLSRGPDEPDAARRLLDEAGFHARVERRGRMVGLVGQLS
jgi:SAM-dependent methyltransferase